MSKLLILMILGVMFSSPMAALAQSSAADRVEENPLSVPTTYKVPKGLAISYYRFLPARNGGFYIYGEYRNTGKDTIIAPSLQFTFTDEKTSIYWKSTTYPVENYLKPEASGVFWDVMSSSDIPLLEGATSLEILACNTEFLGSSSSQRADIDLQITRNELTFNEAYNSASGMIEVTNMGTAAAAQPAFYAVGRDEKDLIDFVEMISMSGPLQPGALTRENASFITPHPIEDLTFSVYEFGMLSIGCVE